MLPYVPVKVDYGKSRHLCDDPVCPDPVWKLSTGACVLLGPERAGRSAGVHRAHRPLSKVARRVKSKTVQIFVVFVITEKR